MGNLSKCSVSALLWIADVIDPHCERQQRVDLSRSGWMRLSGLQSAITLVHLWICEFPLRCAPGTGCFLMDEPDGQRYALPTGIAHRTPA